MILKPVDGNIKITSRYGTRIHPVTKKRGFHNGIDIGVREGEKLLAVADGKVIINKTNNGGVNSGYGHYLVIEHDGFCTLYAHMKELSRFRVGQVVKQGETIGYSGNTGSSTGPHLHFEVRKGKFSSSFFNKNVQGKYLNSIDPETFELNEEWKEILKKETTNPSDWIRFFEKNKSDKIGKFLPDLILKLYKKS